MAGGTAHNEGRVDPGRVTPSLLQVCGMNERLCQGDSENVRGRTSMSSNISGNCAGLRTGHLKDVQEEFGSAALECNDRVLLDHHRWSSQLFVEYTGTGP